MYRTIFLCICFIRLGVCWEIILDRGGIYQQDPSYINGYMNVSRYNRTNYAIRYNAEFFKDLPCSAYVDLRLYGLFSNVYKELPFKIVRNFKDGYALEYKFFAVEMRQYTNLPEDCPIRKGKYYIKEFSPNLGTLKKFMPIIPWDTDKYLIDWKVIIEGKTIFETKIYVRITRMDEYIIQK